MVEKILKTSLLTLLLNVSLIGAQAGDNTPINFDQELPEATLAAADLVIIDENKDKGYGLALLFFSSEDLAPDDSLRGLAVPPQDTPSPVVEEAPAAPYKSVMFASQIYNQLIQYTIGQDKAMRSLASFIHDHLINLKLCDLSDADPHEPGFADLILEKPNMLMMGPTGCGKTSSLMRLSKILDIPVVVGNATEWTSQGYVGGKWQDIFSKLFFKARAILQAKGIKPTMPALQELVERSIVFIDEIDKLCTGGELDVIDRVQQELLPVIQGTVLELEEGTIDTTNILFVGGGAFPGLIPATNDKTHSKRITPHMLEKYGLLPELAGRLCNIIQFSPLDKEDLKKIILHSKASMLSQYIRKYKLAYNIDLVFEEGAIDYIAEAAAQLKTGARAIHAMLFTLMEEKTFNLQQFLEEFEANEANSDDLAAGISKPRRMCITQAEAMAALQEFVADPSDNKSHHLSMYS
ncbi:AAA family ATPase [Candidatus Odyssella thessalonicensis]|uniref:AAA family ATPase n=1 Tax=Candidatus Odyssella thessalonicensis TaxID=84647 RepID=UPI000225B929|nr:AAA family ATPase [Candidatus Odyssella thessalonicensis]